MRDTTTHDTWVGGGGVRLQMLRCNVLKTPFTMFVLVCGTRIPYPAGEVTGSLSMF